MPITLRALDLPTLDQLEVDAYALFVAEDERPLSGLGGLIDWRMAALLSQHLQGDRLLGGVGESFLTTPGGFLKGKRIFAFGLGPLARVTPELFSSAATRAVAVLQRAGVASLAIGLPEAPPLPQSARLLVTALKPLSGIDVSLFGSTAEISVVLPELSGSSAR